jgi:hypothetical protein
LETPGPSVGLCQLGTTDASGGLLREKNSVKSCVPANTTVTSRYPLPRAEMGQSESRNSSRQVYVDSGYTRYYDGLYSPRYEVKKDTYEFWNTVDRKVPNALGSRLSDYEVRPRSNSFTYQRYYEPTEVTTLYERPISTTIVHEPYYYPAVQTVPATQTYSTTIPVVRQSGAYTSTYQPYTVTTPTYSTATYPAKPAM